MTEATGSGADQRRFVIVVLAIFVVKLVIALLVIPYFRDQIGFFYGIGPADNYDDIGRNISRGYGYRLTPDTGLTLLREPGYPYFVAALYYLFNNGLKAAIVANLVFSSGSAFLIRALARSVSPSRWVALVAPILFLLYPGVVIAELRSGVEMLFILLILCFLYLMRKALDTGKLNQFIAAGLALGVASNVRSTALLFPPFLILYGVWQRCNVLALLRLAAKLALTMVVALIVLVPWIVRNYNLVGKFIPTASVIGVTMNVGYYSCTHSASGKGVTALEIEGADLRNQLAKERGYRFIGDYYQFFYDPRDEVEFYDSLRKEVVQEYSKSPALFVKCASENVLDFWFAGRNRTSTLINVFIQLPYMLLACAGLILGFRQADRPTLATLLLFVCYTVAVYAPIHAIARYSVPLIPILAILAAIPISRLLGRRLSSA